MNGMQWHRDRDIELNDAKAKWLIKHNIKVNNITWNDYVDNTLLGYLNINGSIIKSISIDIKNFEVTKVEKHFSKQLTSIAEKCPNATKIHVKGNSSESEVSLELFKDLSMKVPKLCHLSLPMLYNCSYRCCDLNFLDILSLWPNMNRLHLPTIWFPQNNRLIFENIKSITIDGSLKSLIHLINACPNLEELVIEGSIREDCFESISKVCKNLKKIHALHSYNDIGIVQLLRLSKDCVKLEDLSLSAPIIFPSNRSVDLSELAFPRLKLLNVSSQVRFDAILAIIMSSQTLTEIELGSHTSMTDENLDLISRTCENVERLSFFADNKLTSGGMMKLASKAIRLKLLDVCIPLEALLGFLIFGNESICVLKYTGNCQSEIPTELPKLCDLKKRCKSLRQILVQLTTLWDDALSVIADSCPNLTSLHIVQCRNILPTKVALNPFCYLLMNCSRIEYLEFSNCILAEVMAVFQCSHKSLKSVKIKECISGRVGSKKIKSNTIPSFPKLQRIDFSESKLLDLQFETITNACSNLSHISFHGCSYISDLSLHRVAMRYPNLCELNLGRCNKITFDGLKFLLESCPYVKVVNLTNCRRLRIK